MQENDKRARGLQRKFWVSPEENEQIKENMARAGIQVFQAYALKMCLSGQVFNVDLDAYRTFAGELAKTNFELKRLGNNINQIAKYANTMEDLPLEQFERLKAELEDVSETVFETLHQEIEDLRDL